MDCPLIQKIIEAVKRMELKGHGNHEKFPRLSKLPQQIQPLFSRVKQPTERFAGKK